MATFFSADAHYTDVGVDGQGARGPQQIVDRLKIGIEPLSGYYHHPRHVVAEGNLVILEHVEEWQFHTGERILHPFVTVMEVLDGEIVRWHDYSNIGNVIDHAPQWWLERIAQGYAAVGTLTCAHGARRWSTTRTDHATSCHDHGHLVGFTEYHERDGVLVFPHTVITSPEARCRVRRHAGAGRARRRARPRPHDRGGVPVRGPVRGRPPRVRRPPRRFLRHAGASSERSPSTHASGGSWRWPGCGRIPPGSSSRATASSRGSVRGSAPPRSPMCRGSSITGPYRWYTAIGPRGSVRRPGPHLRHHPRGRRVHPVPRTGHRVWIRSGG